MIFVLTFGLSLTTILGAYWYFVVRLEDRDKASLVSRLKGYRPQATIAGVHREQERLSHIPWLDRVLSRRSSLIERPQQLLAEAGLTINVGTFFISCFAAAAVVFFLAWQLIHMFVVALVAGLFGAAIPYAYAR